MKRISISMLILILMLAVFPAYGQGSLMEQGNNYARQKNWDKAIESYRKVIAAQPGNAMAYNNLGYVLAARGLYEEAIAQYEQALKIKPDYKEAEQNILAATASYSQDLIDTGKYSTSIELLSDAIKRYPKAGELYYYLGVSYQAQGKFREALQEWKKASEISPSSSTAHYVKAVEKIMGKDTSGAVTSLKEAIKVMPENAYAHNMLGILQVQTGAVADATQSFEKAIKYKPNYAEPYLNLAFLAEKEGRNEDALRYYRTATMKNPYSLKALNEMGKIYFKSNRFFDAESSFKRALRVQPLSSELHKALALTYTKQNKYSEAVAEFETAVNLNPKDAESLYALGLIYKSASGDPGYAQRAQQAFGQCVTVDPGGRYGQMASQKLAEMGGAPPPAVSSAAASPAAGEMPFMAGKMPEITAESPEGDLALTVTAEWNEIPVGPEGADKLLWLMSNLKKGITLTVYRPQNFSGNIDTVRNIAEKELKSRGIRNIVSKDFTISGNKGYLLYGAASDGKLRCMYCTYKNGKAYMFNAEVPQESFIADVDKIISGVVIK